MLITPNVWSYKFLVAAATPFEFHKWIGRYRYRRSIGEDMFPTLYRANTILRLTALLERAGFPSSELVLLSNGPTWFRGMPVLFELGCVYHKLIEAVPALSFLRCAIVASGAKPGARTIVPDELRVRCSRCSSEGMALKGERWTCPRCENAYDVRGNVRVTV